MINKIDHITVVVRELEEAKKFFQKFGFEVQKEGNLEGEWIDTVTNLRDVKAKYVTLSLPGQKTNLELMTFTSPEGEECPSIDIPTSIGFRHVAFEVDNIEAVVETLEKEGVKFFSDIQTYKESNKKLCYFKGPEGIILELAEYEK